MFIMKSILCRPVVSLLWVAILQISSLSTTFATKRNVRMIVTPPTWTLSPQQADLSKHASSPLYQTTGIPHYYVMTSTSKGVNVAPINSQIGVSPFKKIRQLLFTPKKDADGLTISQKLRKMGMSVLLSYAFVSNMTCSATISLAWFIFSKQSGMVRSHKMLLTACYRDHL
jgi:hypothetical protein